MSILLPEERLLKIPKLYKHELNLDLNHITNVEEVVKREMRKEFAVKPIKSGMKVAVAVGSRGIENILSIVNTIIEEIKDNGGNPFIVGAMGSHGKGSEEGQRQVLDKLGINEENLKVPVITEPQVVRIGELEDGTVVYFSRAAYEADMIIPVNRIKPHTDFDGKKSVESGICKMIVMGLGNRKGCVSVHSAGIEKFPAIIIEAAEMLLKKTKIGFGIGIVENAIGKTVHVESISRQTLPYREVELLNYAKEKMAKLPFTKIDILIIDEIGKDISGSGADPNIIGRLGPKKYSKDVPQISYIIILGITERSNGNATGIGFADIITKDVFNAINMETTYTNCLAGGSRFGLECAKIPPVAEDETEAIQLALKMWKGNPEKCKIVRIKNTKELETIYISKNLKDCIAKEGGKDE